MRTGEIKRETLETNINLRLDLDSSGIGEIDTGVGFLDHMLTLFSRHGNFNLSVKCIGDIKVDDHHSVEDIGICLGEAFKSALGDMKGITRYADRIIPMDEALVLCAVDISGRAFLSCSLDIPSKKVGAFDTELITEFLSAFVRTSQITLHIKQLSGDNSHHILECCFKALGKTLSDAAAIDAKNADKVPSTKGVL